MPHRTKYYCAAQSPPVIYGSPRFDYAAGGDAMDAMTTLRASELANLLVEVLPADGEAMGLVRAKGRVRRKYDCTNMQFEEALCLAAGGGKIKRVFGCAMLARNV